MSKHTKNNPLERLKHHVTGAIERGEKTAIEAVTSFHTKGPWHITKATSDGEIIQIRDTLKGDNSSIEIETRAQGQVNWKNARLIASAPELLEMLKAIDSLVRLKQVDLNSSVHSNLRKLIAKATGES